jgi:leader peptidase (prepilin peptidase) / N-methyltransferase
MLSLLLEIPLELRCLAVFLLGVGLGALVNLGIYALAWHPRPISPWLRPVEPLPPRRWPDRLPVVGWLRLRREATVWGTGFWVRPLLLEVAIGAGLALIYYWQVTGALIPTPPLLDLPLQNSDVQTMLHQRFASQTLLILLMLVATFIDFDEKTIPDWITVPGTLAGLILATVWPRTLPTSLQFDLPPHPPALDFLWLTAPLPWPPTLHAEWGLGLGLFCFAGWNFGILEKRWTLRRGWRKAFQYFFVSIFRYHNWPLVLAMTLVGLPAIGLVWWLAPPGSLAWPALLTSLVGMAFGGSLVWAIRIIGAHTLGREAMGFGDVTLMAMIGAFVGWQGALLAFFFAPFAALFIALANWLVTGRRDLAFGPYLCAGGLYVLLRWPEIWEPPFGVRHYFALGAFIPAVVVLCLAAMWLMLHGLRFVRERIFGG